ncbi:MAG: acyltransferase [Solirubrobacterales bacterium]|nr:acyltransferase [Solirubrobacterales bacterium]
MRRGSTDGTWWERRRLLRRARAAGAEIRTPFRLPHGAGGRPSERLTLGRGAWIGPGAWLNLNGEGADVRIGAGTVIGHDLTIGAGGRIDIGEGCLFSARCTILDQLHDYEHWILPALAEGRAPHFDWSLTDPRPVVVGAGTWLGINVTVLPGVTIGQGCVIGAGSVVTRDVPDFHIAAGVPARVLRPVGARDPELLVPEVPFA